MGNYHQFRVKYDMKYKIYYDKYYYAMILFDMVIKNYERGTTHLSVSLLNEIKGNFKGSKNFWKNILTSLISKLNYLYSKIKRHNSVLILDSNKFKLLNEAIKTNTKKNKKSIKVVAPKKIMDIRGIIIPKTVIYNKDLKNLLESISIENLPEILENEYLMNSFNLNIKKSVFQVNQILKVNNIESIYTISDQKFENRLICEAAKLSQIPFFVFLHGYPQGGEYIGVLPFHGSKLLVWNREQKERLSKIMDINKLEIFGYPKFDKLYLKKFQNVSTIKNKITFISQPFEETGINFKRELVYSKLSKYKDDNYIINIRLHPKEKDDLVKINQIINMGFKVSTDSLLYDIYSSSKIIGYNSSVLYEAFLISNDKVYQIDDDTPINFKYSFIKKLYLEDLEEIKNNDNHNTITQSKYLIEDFKTEVKHLLISDN
ncbi:hypothetical protein [Alkalibacterium kapii]|uniref:Uncharacterized protein n=1 Tax=Alkalibacterium kapii TaxID=426704 RepID=A0A511AUL2_9LACT|nr:hypothetical protein [Alkalibacterium kapii]GEK91033.1 hypothetical protein AKA01nite_06550 [Alkalibacterium kapii]